VSPVPAVLSVAGSDSGGGAGIQADLKAFAACGVHGMTAIAALTAQNTVEVADVLAVPPEFVVAQMRAVARDIGVDAVKTGMLGDAAVIAAVADALDELGWGTAAEARGPTPVVVDPVLVAESGAVLLPVAARSALVEKLLPRATVVTPNVAEARALAGPGFEHAEPEELARAVAALGPRYVVVTGGHREQATDLFFDGEQAEAIPGERHADGAAHGSGCTHASALAAHLALGWEPLEAARRARAVAGEAVRRGLREIGSGPGPVDALGVAARAQRARAPSGAVTARRLA
jgi:hydroxymethylpyrimidine/phosphomethylpyrimidine kinase